MLLKIIISLLFFLVSNLLQAENTSNVNYGNLPNFKFTDAFGNEVDNDQIKNNIVVLNLFFTSCPQICPIINGKIATLANKYKEKEDLKFISISVDPTRDTIEVLQGYSKKFNANTNQWKFISLEKGKLDNFLDSLKLATFDDPNNHSTRIFLIENNSKIHSTYQGLDTDDFTKLNQAIEELLEKD